MMRVLPGFLLAAAVTVYGQDVYRSVDSSGKVTYSETPIDGAVHTRTVELLAPPTPEDVQAAQTRYEDLAILAAQMEQERRARDEARARYTEKQEYFEFVERWYFIPEPVILDFPTNPSQKKHRRFTTGSKESKTDPHKDHQRSENRRGRKSLATAAQRRTRPGSHARSASLQPRMRTHQARFGATSRYIDNRFVQSPNLSNGIQNAAPGRGRSRY